MARVDIYLAHRVARIDMSKQGIKVIPCNNKEEINVIIKIVDNNIDDCDEVSSFSEALFEGLYGLKW